MSRKLASALGNLDEREFWPASVADFAGRRVQINGTCSTNSGMGGQIRQQAAGKNPNYSNVQSRRQSGG